MSDTVLDVKMAALSSELRRFDSLLVAFSGGADSALVLAAAVRTLGPGRVAAATAVSPSLAASELAAARRVAATLGVTHYTPTTNEMARAGYVANGRDRCFHCKTELLSVLGPLAGRLGLQAVATGTNADDIQDRFRPGIRAARDAGAVTPLADAGLTKQHVRALSSLWGLVTADKPAAACLSSRVAYGLEITPRVLGRVEKAERDLRAALHAAGLTVSDLRVRDLGSHARVEVDSDLVPSLLARPELLGAITGFGRVEVDVRGFRSGSMNEPS